MFGKFKIPFEISEGDLRILAEEHKKGFLYKKEHNGEELKKFVATNEKEIIINPIEPVNNPKCIFPPG